MAKVSSPTRRGASESAATLPAGASTGRPAPVRGSGTVPPRAPRRPPGPGPRTPAAIPASRPPPPTLASTVRGRRVPAAPARRQRAGPEDRLGWSKAWTVRAPALPPTPGCRQRIGVGGAPDDQIGAVDRGCGRSWPGETPRDKDRAGTPRAGPHRRRLRHDCRRTRPPPGAGDVAQQQVRERAPDLERPRVLEVLEFEHQRPGRGRSPPGRPGPPVCGAGKGGSPRPRR